MTFPRWFWPQCLHFFKVHFIAYSIAPSLNAINFSESRHYGFRTCKHNRISNLFFPIFPTTNIATTLIGMRSKLLRLYKCLECSIFRLNIEQALEFVPTVTMVLKFLGYHPLIFVPYAFTMYTICKTRQMQFSCFILKEEKISMLYRTHILQYLGLKPQIFTQSTC